MANIMKGLGGSPKTTLFKVGSVSMNYGYSKTTTATLNISTVYSHYKDITVDDICFPLTYCRGWGDGFGATLSDFVKSYNANTGVITISATGGYNYCNAQFTCDIYVLDRFGGVVSRLLSTIKAHFYRLGVC